MTRIKKWLKDLGESPALLLKVGGLILVAGLLQRAGFLPEVMGSIAGLLCVTMAILGIATLYVAAARPDTQEPEAPLIFHPGLPGQRTWKHSVYDENAYAILGVPQSATRMEIRDAFKRLAQQYHPDAAPAEDKERAALVFMRVDQAYELLSDPDNRARYDAWIEYLNGAEPALDAACEMFKNSEGRACFDREIKPCLPSAAPVHTSKDVERETAPTSPPKPAERGDQAEPQLADATDAAPEVEMPEAVREARGAPGASTGHGQPD